MVKAICARHVDGDLGLEFAIGLRGIIAGDVDHSWASFMTKVTVPSIRLWIFRVPLQMAYRYLNVQKNKHTIQYGSIGNIYLNIKGILKAALKLVFSFLNMSIMQRFPLI
jgi:hypothetical protein